MQIFKITLWFPGHCGNPAYLSPQYFAGENFDKAVELCRLTYLHATVRACECLGELHVPKTAADRKGEQDG
jgi:hypothetical protein